MFGFRRKSEVAGPSAAILRALKSDGWPPGVDTASALGVVESRGAYTGRKVTYFRVFDPASTAQRSLDIRRYQDFDVFAGLILRSGHVERDGTVVLTRPVIVRAADTPIRTHADRTLHTDDAHIVRGETGGSPSSSAIPTSVSGQAP